MSAEAGKRFGYDEVFAEIRTTYTLEPHVWDRMVLQVLAMSGTNLAAEQLPCHDPPVAWRAPGYAGIPCVVCPALAREWTVLQNLGPSYLDPPPVVLDAEPGRRP